METRGRQQTSCGVAILEPNTPRSSSIFPKSCCCCTCTPTCTCGLLFCCCVDAPLHQNICSLCRKIISSRTAVHETASLGKSLLQIAFQMAATFSDGFWPFRPHTNVTLRSLATTCSAAQVKRVSVRGKPQTPGVEVNGHHPETRKAAGTHGPPPVPV